MDEKPVLSLSPSCAATLLSRSPLHAWREHYHGGGEAVEPTAAMRRGKLIDRLVFNHKADGIVVVEADSWRTKDAQQKRAEAEAAGHVAVLADAMAEARGAAVTIQAELAARGIPLDGPCVEVQRRLMWMSDGVPCKGFADLVVTDATEPDPTSFEVYDLKITEDASPAGLRLDLRSSLQHAAYTEAFETLHPAAAGRVRMRFIFAEPDGMGLTIVEPDGQFKELARARWRRAVKAWGECLAKNEWPSYGREVVQLSPKPWELAAELDAMPDGGSPGVTF